MSCCTSVVRVLENIPLLGHLIAACYACSGSREKAERAAIKSTVGIILAPVNITAEAIDEVSQKRTEKLRSGALSSRRDWMKRHHRKALRSLCLPGAHSSGMYKVSKTFSRMPLVDGWAKCQKEDVYQQLRGGVRFLDVRLVMSEGEVYVIDDSCYARGVTLKDLLSSVKRFISESTSEIVCLHVQEGPLPPPPSNNNDQKGQRRASYLGSVSDVDWNKVKMLFQQLLKDKLIPEIMRDLVISDIVDQGRNVFVCGLPLELNIGWHNPPITHIRPHDASPDKLLSHLQSCLDEPPPVPSSITWYHAESAPRPSQVAHSMGGLAGLLASRHTTHKYDTLEDLAAAVNWSVLEAMRDMSRVPLNTITMDYVQDEVIERIVQLNDAAETGKYMLHPPRLDESIVTGRYSSMARLDESIVKQRSPSRMDESILGVEGMRVSGVKLDESVIGPPLARPTTVRMDESTVFADDADYTHNNSMFISQRSVNLSVMTASANMNQSFEFRPAPSRPIQVRDTTV